MAFLYGIMYLLCYLLFLRSVSSYDKTYLVGGLYGVHGVQIKYFLRFVHRASLYNLVNKANLVHNFLSMFVSFRYMFHFHPA